MSIWGSTIKAIKPTDTIKPIAISSIQSEPVKTEQVTPIVYSQPDPIKKTFFQKAITLNGLVNDSYVNNNRQFLYVHYFAYLKLIVIFCILLYEYFAKGSDTLSLIGITYFIWIVLTKIVLEYLTPPTEIFVNGERDKIKLPIYNHNVPTLVGQLLLP